MRKRVWQKVRQRGRPKKWLPGEGNSASLLAAVDNAVGKLEREPGPWEVMSISTPATVLNDLARSKAGPAPNKPHMARTPEQNLLGRLGRRDLIAERGQQRPGERR